MHMHTHRIGDRLEDCRLAPIDARRDARRRRRALLARPSTLPHTVDERVVVARALGVEGHAADDEELKCQKEEEHWVEGDIEVG